VPGTVAHEQRASGNPAYQATDATGPVLPVVGAVGPQLKQAAAAAQQYVAATLGGEGSVFDVPHQESALDMCFEAMLYGCAEAAALYTGSFMQRCHNARCYHLSVQLN
jgi:hypothetical protein